MSIIKQLANGAQMAAISVPTGSTVGSTQTSSHNSPRSIVVESLEDYHCEGMIRLAAIDGRFHTKAQFDDDYEWTNAEAGRGVGGVVRVAERVGGNCFESEIHTLRCVKSYRKRSQVGRDPEEVEEELKRECSIYLSVDHPNIARLIDVYEDEFNVTMVMEYCRGGTLEACISRDGAITEARSQLWMFQILLAVRYLHHKGVAHRDIKPLNIVFSDDSNDPLVKLIDFDAAQTCPDLDTGDMLRGGAGTPCYMSPEIFANMQDNGNCYDTKTDLWSTGVTLFKMLSGREPFAAPPYVNQVPCDSEDCSDFVEEEWVIEIRKGNYSISTEEWSKVSALAKDLVQMLLTVDPHKRPSAAQAIDHLWVKEKRDGRSKLPFFSADSLGSSVLNAFVAFVEVSDELRYELQKICYSKVDFEMQQVLPIFGAFDRKEVGCVDVDDFTAALHDMQAEITDQQCVHLFGRLTACFDEKTASSGASQRSFLQYSEFMAAVLPIITMPAFIETLTDGHGIGLSVLDIEHDLRAAFNLGGLPTRWSQL
jgi:serine/threonine protein kinase